MRSYKRENDITHEDLELMLKEISGKESSFEWSQEKIEKVEKKYKDFIIGKLKRFKKDSNKEVKNKLAQFIRESEDHNRTMKDIVRDLVPLLKVLNYSEVFTKIGS